MNKIKISNHQVFALTASFTCGSGILVISATATGLAKQDAWISVLFTLAISLFEIWIISLLWKAYPSMTYIDMLKQIFGKWIGGIIAVGFVFLCINSVPQITWYMNTFIRIEAMPETPPYAIGMVYIIVLLAALLYGLEAFSRAYEIFIYFISFLFILAMILVSPNAKIQNLQPIFEKGIIPILKGSFVLSGFLVFPIIILFMIYPVNTDNTLKVKKSFLKGYFWGGALIFISVIMSLLVLGSTITSNSQYPVYLLAKEINVGIIFTRLEFVVALVWITTLILRGILFFYAGIIGLAQLLGLKEHKKIIMPMGLIVLVLSQVVYPDVIYQADWDIFAWIPFIGTYGFVIPILMVVIFYIKKKLLV